MADLTSPLMYVTLAGEMLYVLDERLVAQSVPADKSSAGELWV
jgi:hypothetical protein